MSHARNIARIIAGEGGVVDQQSYPQISGGLVTSGVIPIDKMPSGTLLQTKKTLYTSYNSMTIDNSWYNVPYMSVDIVPKRPNSTYRIDIRWFGEVVGSWDVVWSITRNGKLINMPTMEGTRNGALGMALQSYIDDNNDSTPEYMCFSTIDYPQTTDIITYKLVVRAWSSRTLWNGRVFSTNTSANYELGSMEMAVTEYAA